MRHDVRMALMRGYRAGYARARADAQREVGLLIDWLNVELTKARAEVWQTDEACDQARALTAALYERAVGVTLH